MPPAALGGPRAVAGLLGATLYKFFGDGCSAMAAAISFYTFFSLPALVTLLPSLAGRVMDPDLLQRAIITQVGGLIGGAGAEQVRTIVQDAHRATSFNIPTLLTLLALGLGATAAFAQLQASLNKLWGSSPAPTATRSTSFC